MPSSATTLRTSPCTSPNLAVDLPERQAGRWPAGADRSATAPRAAPAASAPAASRPRPARRSAGVTSGLIGPRHPGPPVSDRTADVPARGTRRARCGSRSRSRWCRMRIGPFVGSQLAMGARAEEIDLVARCGRHSSGPRSTTNWSMAMRPTDRAAPSIDGDLDPAAWRAWDAVGIARLARVPAAFAVRGPRAAVGARSARRRRPSRWRGGPQRHGRYEPEARARCRSAGAGVSPYMAMPVAHEIEPTVRERPTGRRCCSGGEVAAQGQGTLGCSTARRGSRRAAAGTVSAPGTSASARCDQIPHRSARPTACAVAAWTRTRGQSLSATPLRDRPVSIFRCTRACTPTGRRAPRQPRRAPRSLDTDRSTPAATQAATSGSPGAHSQASIRPVSPMARRARASLGQRDAEPLGSAGAAVAGDGHAVAVGVGLDDRHDLCPPARSPHAGEVRGASRRDHRPRPASATARPGPASSPYRAMPDRRGKRVGDRWCRDGCGARRDAARGPCSHTAAATASMQFGRLAPTSRPGARQQRADHSRQHVAGPGGRRGPTEPSTSTVGTAPSGIGDRPCRGP